MIKYKVITVYGHVEFGGSQYDDAVLFHAAEGIEPIETIEYELPLPNQMI